MDGVSNSISDTSTGILDDVHESFRARRFSLGTTEDRVSDSSWAIRIRAQQNEPEVSQGELFFQWIQENVLQGSMGASVVRGGLRNFPYHTPLQAPIAVDTTSEMPEIILIGGGDIFNQWIPENRLQEYMGTFGTRRGFGNASYFAPLANDTTSEMLKMAEMYAIEVILTDECADFCESHNIIETLHECIGQIRQDFESILIKIQAELTYFCDEEDDDEPRVILEVEVESSREVAESNYDRWLDWFVDLPNSTRKFFILTIDRV